MKVIRLVLSLSLVLAFTASASEAALTHVTDNSNTTSHLDCLNDQSFDILTTHYTLIESSLFSGIDTDLDYLTVLAFKRSVIKNHESALAGNTHISPFFTAQWHFIRGPPMSKWQV